MATASQIEEIKATLQRGLENLALSGNLKPLPLRQQAERPRLKSQTDPRRYSDSFPRRRSPASIPPGSRESILSQRSSSMVNITGSGQRRRPLSAKGVEIPHPHRTPNGTFHQSVLRTPPSRGLFASDGSVRTRSNAASVNGTSRPLAANPTNRLVPSPPRSPQKTKQGGAYFQSGAIPKDIGKRVNGDGMVTKDWVEDDDDGEEWSDVDETEEDGIDGLDTPAR